MGPMSLPPGTARAPFLVKKVSMLFQRSWVADLCTYWWAKILLHVYDEESRIGRFRGRHLASLFDESPSHVVLARGGCLE